MTIKRAGSDCPLTRTLPGPHPATDYPKMVPTAFGPLSTSGNSTVTTTTTTATITITAPSIHYFNYYAQCRRLDMEPWAVVRKDLHLDKKVLLPEEVVYLRVPENRKQQEQNAIFMCRHTIGAFLTQAKLFWRYYQAFLFHTVVWTLVSPILEQLQSITISLSDIQR